MFEDSLVESQGRLASSGRGWITLGAVGLQCLVAGVMVIVPMVRPEALSVKAMVPVVVLPVLEKAPVMVRERPELVSRVAAAVSLPSVMAATRVAVLPSMRAVDSELAGGVPLPSGPIGMSGPGGADVFSPVGSGARNVVIAAPKKAELARVSAGVSAGMLLGEIRPVYPQLAVMARVEGTVVVEAMISKAGTVESARVVSGPAMLAGAALDAVKGARYRPYQLNGEATEVQTTVTVKFRLGEG